jgi:hypothetical protein
MRRTLNGREVALFFCVLQCTRKEIFTPDSKYEVEETNDTSVPEIIMKSCSERLLRREPCVIRQFQRVEGTNGLSIWDVGADVS